MSKGKLIVIVAPSGTGKSTLIARLKREFKSLRESVSFTTREPRENERDGVHYFFISRKEFESKIEKGDFLEWFLVHNDYKGTSKRFVERNLNEGKDLLFDVDVQGADALKNEYGDDARVIFIAPPSEQELEKRLINRGTETEESLKIRLENAKKELQRKDSFDYCVVNDVLDEAYDDLSSIVKGILEEE